MIELNLFYICAYIVGTFVVIAINNYEATTYKTEFTFLEFMVSCLLSWFTVILWLITIWLIRITRGR